MVVIEVVTAAVVGACAHFDMRLHNSHYTTMIVVF